MTGLHITGVRLTPVAFADPPLLNAVGVHEPFALRTVVEIDTDAGVTGLGETYGDDGHLALMHRVTAGLIGRDCFELTRLHEQIRRELGGTARQDLHGLTGISTETGTADRVFAGYETALLDAQGKALGRPVSDLLGGRVRDTVPFSAYLFYKWAGHPDAPTDDWGPALTSAQIVTQAERMVTDYGFGSIKLKGGVFEPAEEIAAIHALRERFPEHALRIDPNAAWSVDTSIEVGRALHDTLEYLEDPTPGLTGMAQVAAAVPMPLATNMCVVDFSHLAPAVAQRSVGVVLSDHHVWGGLRASIDLASVCRTFGLGLSMHSNSHLGISLAAMVQLAASVPNLTYACDTHWPWKRSEEDVVVVGALRFVDGAVPVPVTPGLGVELDADALGRLHEQYERCGIRRRNDTAYLQRFQPSYRADVPRW